MAQSSVFRSSFLAVNSHGRRLHLGEVLLPMITSKHAHLCLAAIEVDPPHLIMEPLVAEDIDPHHYREEAHRRGGMEVVRSQEIVI